MLIGVDYNTYLTTSVNANWADSNGIQVSVIKYHNGMCSSQHSVNQATVAVSQY